MAHSKAELFADPEDINHIVSGYSKALDYPARVLIMRWLAAEGPKNAGEITNYVGLSKSTTSQHLFRLERAGIITGMEQGNNIIYAFNAANFIIMRGYMDDLFHELDAAIKVRGSRGT
ncbi:MAG TPA: winged helix-turn-helix domain-containing protein [Saprospiraceae bacterium]|nr:winged helix-turn-helix domain-containing protein [Saprospiraceae bacterium]